MSLLKTADDLLSYGLGLLPEVLHFIEFGKRGRVLRIQKVVVDDRLHLGVGIHAADDRIDDIVILQTSRSKGYGSCVVFFYDDVDGDDALTIPVVGQCEQRIL